MESLTKHLGEGDPEPTRMGIAVPGLSKAQAPMSA